MDLIEVLIQGRWLSFGGWHLKAAGGVGDGLMSQVRTLGGEKELQSVIPPSTLEARPWPGDSRSLLLSDSRNRERQEAQGVCFWAEVQTDGRGGWWSNPERKAGGSSFSFKCFSLCWSPGWRASSHTTIPPRSRCQLLTPQQTLCGKRLPRVWPAMTLSPVIFSGYPKENFFLCEAVQGCSEWSIRETEALGISLSSPGTA